MGDDVGSKLDIKDIISDSLISNVKFSYKNQDILLCIDFDDYIESFPDMEIVRIKILGKNYDITRKSLIRFLETMENL